MAYIRRSIAFAFLSLFSIFSIAGVEKESRSTLSGLFYAYLFSDGWQVLVSFDAEEKLRNLVNHCKAGRHVYLLENGARYKCKTEQYKTPAGEEDWQQVGMTVQGPRPKSDRRYFGAFVTKPTRMTKWSTRALAPDELASLQSLLNSDSQRFKAIAKHGKLSSAKLTYKEGSQRAVVLVPGKVVGGPDDFYNAQRHYAFVWEGEKFVYMGILPAKPQKFFDLDGDDLPEIQVEESCDGICVTLWSLKGSAKQIATFGGH